MPISRQGTRTDGSLPENALPIVTTIRSASWRGVHCHANSIRHSGSPAIPISRICRDRAGRAPVTVRIEQAGRHLPPGGKRSRWMPGCPGRERRSTVCSAAERWIEASRVLRTWAHRPRASGSRSSRSVPHDGRRGCGGTRRLTVPGIYHEFAVHATEPIASALAEELWGKPAQRRSSRHTRTMRRGSGRRILLPWRDDPRVAACWRGWARRAGVRGVGSVTGRADQRHRAERRYRTHARIDPRLHQAEIAIRQDQRDPVNDDDAASWETACSLGIDRFAAACGMRAARGAAPRGRTAGAAPGPRYRP